MSTRAFPHTLNPARPPQLGVVVLQADETLEPDLRRLIGAEAEVLVTRIPSGREITPETLAAMEAHLAGAAALLPAGARFSALAYACTSGAAQIGPERVADILRDTTGVARVTDPVTALVAAAGALGLSRVGLLSPYVSEVSDRIRAVLAGHGIATPVFGSFNVAEEARVVRIAPRSIREAAVALAAEGGIDALFLSCTNLRTLDLIEELERTTGLPVLSSNLVLAWHLSRIAGIPLAPGPWGRLAAL
jgi:maleate isomerase